MDVDQQYGKGKESRRPNPDALQCSCNRLELRKRPSQPCQNGQVAGPKDIVCRHVVVRSKFDGHCIQFSLERAEQLVPDHQRAPEVAIHVGLVLAVMRPVVGRGDHDALEEP